MKVFGDDLSVLEEKARRIRDVIASVRGAAETSVDVSAGAMQVELALDRPALAIIVPLVLLLIVGLLYASFGSGRQALLVMLNVPFALVGGIAALWLRGLNLSLSASVGFIALFGVAVLNGVVLIAYINQRRAEGQPLDQAVREGSEIRLRPVLMTALGASFGFIPMAISTGAGSEVQRPLATVVIGGLVTSTVLTLIVLPVLYEWLETTWPAWTGTVRARVARRRRAKASTATAAIETHD